jgi:hypothetical protein
MKKLICLLILVAMLSGCTTLSGIRNLNRRRLNRLSIGMTKKQVLRYMGEWSKRCYEYGFLLNLLSLTSLASDNAIVNNPYRSETLQGKDKVIEVLYYVTDIKGEDAAIDEHVFTPLVFDEGKLIGWGHNFLDACIEKYGIKIK